MTLFIRRIPCAPSRPRGTPLLLQPAALLPTPLHRRLASLALLMASLLKPTAALAHPPPVSETIEVSESRADSLVGQAETSSEGTVGAAQLEVRPVLRPGELIEAVPGIVVTQHSGDGKANQYFLRGFNLDHGTDLALTVEGMPVNMPTHAHGQGYADLNFVIPELVEGIQYQKGPHHASVGDFGAAGAVQLGLYRALPAGLALLSVGDYGFRRLVAAASPHLGPGQLLAAIEAQETDGPWEVPEALQKVNGLLRYSAGDPTGGISILGMAYRATWTATDQIPDRSVEAGTLGPFGSMDGTAGGQTLRASLSLALHRRAGAAAQRMSAYLYHYRLNLWSNFTYFLEDRINGDQFEQADNRIGAGLQAEHTMTGMAGPLPGELKAGLQTRLDVIPQVGLYRTVGRSRLSTVREDEVVQGSSGLWVQGLLRPTLWLRGAAGLRGDFYVFNVEAEVPENTGAQMSFLASPKLSLIAGPFGGAELYLNLGRGFHSNDARGTTQTREPTTGAAVTPVTALVPAWGAEVGGRLSISPVLQSALTLWALELDSELLFIGDAGTTEASRPSRRVGLEWANYWTPSQRLQVDADLALTQARFLDEDPAGPFIPGAVERVISVGATAHLSPALQVGARLRHFGPRPLTEDNRVRSDPSTLVHTGISVAPTREWKLELECFNLLNSAVPDQQYFYTSRLAGEPEAGVEDIHTHPAEPRSIRLSFVGRF